jgi:hypothetical protein
VDLLEGVQFSSPTPMIGFLDVKISTITGIIVLVLVAGSVGLLIFYQFNQVVNIQMRAIDRQIEEIK